jgi:aspartyl-tRNA(Asn)/glutamyl-tRNA(Gln) amidotransferase subunit C
MTHISTDDVQRMALLSNLKLDPSEVEPLREELENIISNITQLDELDTENVEPTYQVTDLQNVWRDDAVNTYGIESDALIALAPDAEAHQIKVPKVL